ncbi:fragmin60 [Reticulomyxa filosa]|uniref:Fragmin60 n=1 Tax=Reticulomyxa filosa TaxID=46433 RepID=X6NBE2_RETFI|nr:fragmin60 [Reticulomyxa filosa]|eukprot:ETO23321.1 fragmin60 [Reticulomyxa filosa]
MAEVGQAKLEDSNMANYGSKEHREMKKNAAEKEPAWEGAGKEAGIQVWRIEKFKVKHWPKEKYGEFFGGDSYIVLHTKVWRLGDKGEMIKLVVFFWLGGETSQDEAGTAAYKTVELDDLLGDEPVQYREVQGKLKKKKTYTYSNESKRFLDIFPKMTVMSGGVESGFNQFCIEKDLSIKIFFNGYKQKVQVYEVPLSVDSLNDSDCFVLDNGLTIFQFNGTKSSAWEKRKAAAIVQGLKASRLGKVNNEYVIDGLKDKGNKLIEEFWTLLGGRPKSIKEEEELKEPPKVTLSMHHVSDASGKMQIKEVCKGKLDKSALVSDDAFIVDAGGMIFVWIGSGANKSEKLRVLQWNLQLSTWLHKDVLLTFQLHVFWKEKSHQSSGKLLPEELLEEETKKPRNGKLKNAYCCLSANCTFSFLFYFYFADLLKYFVALHYVRIFCVNKIMAL